MTVVRMAAVRRGGPAVRDRRRGRSAAATVVAVACLLLAGCSRPPGSDGSLTDDWPALAEPRPNVPRAHACHIVEGAPERATRLAAEVNCDWRHSIQIPYVGSFEGDVAARPTPPPAGGPDRRAAYQRCMAETRTFVGGDWRLSDYLVLTMAVPDEAQWSGGGRWYRCDLSTDSANSAVGSFSQNSFEGYMADKPSRCYTATLEGDSVKYTGRVECTKPHQAEIVGYFDAPDTPYPDDAAARRKLRESGCRGVVAAYLGVPDDASLPRRIGWGFADFDRAAWERGDRGARCSVLSPDGASRSLKGAGPAALPVG